MLNVDFNISGFRCEKMQSFLCLPEGTDPLDGSQRGAGVGFY